MSSASLQVSSRSLSRYREASVEESRFFFIPTTTGSEPDSRLLIVILVSLFLTLPLQLVDGFLGAVLDQITVVVDTTPLWLSIRDVKYASRVKHVAAGEGSVMTIDWGAGGSTEFLPDFKVLSILGSLEVDQGREQQDHVSSFVHDGSSAVGTADLARQLVNTSFLRTLIPAQIVMAVCEVDVVFVEDGCPLEGCTLTASSEQAQRTHIERERTVNLLACGTMAVLCVQRFLPTQLIPDLAAVTTSFVASLEILCLVVNSVWRTVLPCIEFSLSGTGVSVVTVGIVRGCHVACCLLRNLIQAEDWR